MQPDSEGIRVSLLQDALSGRISRRSLLKRAAAAGLTAPVIAGLLAACADDADDGDVTDDTASDDAEAVEAAELDDDDPEEEPDEEEDPDDVEDEPADDDMSETPEAGGGGRLDLLWWQAIDILNPHLALGGKDFDAAHLMFEAMAYLDDEGQLVPRLAVEIPSLENGTVDEDAMWVDWTIRDDVYWHDGEHLTAEDVAFTFQFLRDEATNATTYGSYEGVSDVEVTDEYSIRVHFEVPTSGWYVPFVGREGLIIPEHLYRDYMGEEARNAPYNLMPIGTGPFRVTDFLPGDTVFLERNENYWQPGKPYFDTVELIGGGDATSVARAVIVTGEGDWATNIQVEADILDVMEEQGEEGIFLAFDNPIVEAIMVNFADPNTEVGGARSEPSTEHPFLTNPLIRQALGLSIQRDVIAERLYGRGGTTTSNVLNAPDWAINPDLTWSFDLDAAAALLDEAGAIDEDGDGVREYNGTPLSMLYTTSTNPIRQSNQEIVKDDLESIGFEVDLKAVDASIYFSSDPGNPDTYSHFYADIQMFTDGPLSPFPLAWAQRFASWEIAEQANSWTGANFYRYSNPEVDALLEELALEVDPDEQARMFQELNRIVTEDHVEIPIVLRRSVVAVSSDLAGYDPGQWRSDLWNVGDWYREE